MKGNSPSSMGRTVRNIVPDGTRWCSWHGTHHDISEFSGKERSCKAGKYAYHIQRKYGIGLLEYQNLIDIQHDKCAVCGSGGWKYVDHNHKTGKVRGLLCPRCNTLVGYIETSPDNIQKAIDYIARNEKELGEE